MDRPQGLARHRGKRRTGTAVNSSRRKHRRASRRFRRGRKRRLHVRRGSGHGPNGRELWDANGPEPCRHLWYRRRRGRGRAGRLGPGGGRSHKPDNDAGSKILHTQSLSTEANVMPITRNTRLLLPQRRSFGNGQIPKSCRFSPQEFSTDGHFSPAARIV